MEPTAETKFIDRIREYIKDRKYISFDALKKYLEKYGEVNEDTLKKTLLRLKKPEIFRNVHHNQVATLIGYSGQFGEND